MDGCMEVQNAEYCIHSLLFKKVGDNKPLHFFIYKQVSMIKRTFYVAFYIVAITVPENIRASWP